MSAPRITPGTPAEIGRLNTAITWVIGQASGGGRAPNVFTTLARHRSLFRRWLIFAGGLMPGGRLSRADTELVILRVADNMGSAYEWDQHARLALVSGLTVEDVERVRQGPHASGFSERQVLLLRAADELHAERVLSDALWASLSAVFDEPELIELCLLIGHYEMLAMTLASLRVQSDAPAAPPRAARLLQRTARRRRS